MLIEGTSGNDTLIGGVDDDQVYGFDGNDSLHSRQVMNRR